MADGQESSAAKRQEFDYTDEEIARARPLTQRVVARLREHASLMRWSELSVEPPVPGSLADEFWNKDMPRLLAAAEIAERQERIEYPDGR